MNILMIAPQPVFSPRGTPISVVNRCRALSALGHTVDLVTYPLGENVDIDGVRWLRAPRIPGIRSVKIGPSAAKLPLDAAVLARATARALRGRKSYDVVHTHEEAGVFGWWFSRLLGIPHLYDMHNGLGVVLTNYGLGERHPVVCTFEWLERKMLGSARSVIVVFPSLAREAERHVPGTDAEIVYNVPVEPRPNMRLAAALRREWAPAGEPVVLYTGTLEPYQGMPLLIDAMAQVSPMPDGRRPRLVVVGGRPDQVAELPAHPDRVYSAGFSPDGRLIVTACRDRAVRVWDWRAGRLACPPFEHAKDAMAATFTPDGRWVLSVGVEGTARAYVKLGAPYPDPHTLEAAVRRLEPAAVPGGGNDLDADVA